MNPTFYNRCAKLCFTISAITFPIALLFVIVFSGTLFYRSNGEETVWENVTLKAVRALRSSETRLIVSRADGQKIYAPCLGDDMCPQYLTDPPTDARRVVFVKQSPDTAIIKTIHYTHSATGYTNRLLSTDEYGSFEKDRVIKSIRIILAVSALSLLIGLLIKRLSPK
ncbi:hypothetical protein [Neisseria sp. CCUG12390]|uniref:hypothetical protein n=1 Tax=Neisseria sp. CCUG12390 TaxID=3392035 RepID=UPI003A102EE9